VRIVGPDQTLQKDCILRFSVPILLLSLAFSSLSVAEDIRYVSDKQYVPLRSGAGNEFRIVHRGIPSGTRLTVARTSDDSEWAEITTDSGTTGWIRTQYLMADVPAELKLSAVAKQAAKTGEESASLAHSLEELQAERQELLHQISSTGSELDEVTQELHQLKQISGKAVQLDTVNRQLMEETENLRSEVEMLQAETQRLRDKIESEDFMNGALAVVFGVIIALVAPRLVPKRRKSSSWA
jgi:SH3 domain protein